MNAPDAAPDSSCWPLLPPPDPERQSAFIQFAQWIAHDVNNLMAVIVGHNAFLRRRLPPAEAPLLEHLDQIAEAGEEVLGLTRQLALYVGRAPFEESLTDLTELMGEALARRPLPSSVVLSAPAPGTLACRGDKAQIAILLAALIGNACECQCQRKTPGHVWVRADETEADVPLVERYRLDRRTTPGRFTRIEVIDDGCGIAPSIAPRLFDPSFSTRIRAHGMGLPIVLGVARAHRGFVLVRSQPDAGSAFQVYLPTTPRARGSATA